MILNGLPDLGPITIARLEAASGGRLAEVLDWPENRLRACCTMRQTRSIRNWREMFDLAREEALLRRWDAAFRTPAEASWPAALRQLPDAPAGLYVCRAGVNLRPGVALVGTRNPSHYGRKVAREFAGALAGAGLTVISGLATGIDTEVHRAALAAGGQTAAVLGSGLDRLYPPENQALAGEIAASGGVWTEFPFGRQADRRSFPQRNRIVSGMSLALVVIESGATGGSMITARFALEQNRPVFAVPNRIDQPASAGCLQLLREGAMVATSAGDVVAELRHHPLQLDLTGLAAPDPTPDALRELAPAELATLQPLREGEPLHPDQICEQSGQAGYAIAANLLLLELRGLVRKRPDGRYERAF
jgi:DNA processing protein